MSKKVFIWCSDIQKNNGEGVLANKFVNDLKKYNKSYIFKIKNLSLTYTKLLRNIFGNNADRFIFPFFGVLYLWFIFLFKNKTKICYVNYLPLWNFLLFLFLPPKTILGPITGGSKYLRKPYSNYLFRKIVLNFFCILSIQILKFRKTKLLFATDLLKCKFTNFKKIKFNYVFKDFKFIDKNQTRNIDIIFYLRSHKNKNNYLFINFALKLCNKYKVITIGEKIKNKNIINLGNVNKKNLYRILQKTKYSFLSPENIYSFFSLDCLTNGVHVFYHKSHKPLLNLKQNMTPVNYYRQDHAIKILEKNFKKRFKSQKKLTLKDNTDFSDYFRF